MTQKAVVLARGLGKRMQRGQPGVQLGPEGDRMAGAGLKALLPVAGRPFLDYVVDSLLRAGLTHVCFVIAPDADAMREAARRIERASGARMECAVQDEALGTADAVLAAEAFAGGDGFVLANADNVYPVEALKRLARVEGDECWVVAFDRDALGRLGNIAPERAGDFAVVTATPAGELTSIIEKPADPQRYAREGRLWVSMNLYRFSPAVFEACRRVEPDPVRAELELTAAVADLAARSDVGCRVHFCREGVLDLTSRADVPAAERMLAGRQMSF